MTNPVFAQIHPSKRRYTNGMLLEFAYSVRSHIYNTIVHPLITHEQWWRSDPYLMFVTAEPVVQQLLKETTQWTTQQ